MNQHDAIEMCRKIETFAPMFGCHVALTGGCLYKDGDRKDVDILFYRIRQVPKIDHDGLTAALVGFGIVDMQSFGWVTKGVYNGHQVDMFFPEDGGSEPYGGES